MIAHCLLRKDCAVLALGVSQSLTFFGDSRGIGGAWIAYSLYSSMSSTSRVCGTRAMLMMMMMRRHVVRRCAWGLGGESSKGVERRCARVE